MRCTRNMDGFDAKAEAGKIVKLAEKAALTFATQGRSHEANEQAHAFGKELAEIWGDPAKIESVGAELEKTGTARVNTHFNTEQFIEVGTTETGEIPPSLTFDNCGTWALLRSAISASKNKQNVDVALSMCPGRPGMSVTELIPEVNKNK